MQIRILFIALVFSSFINCRQAGPKGDADFIIMINYELGMHCTGFDFEYCCVLPPYNSIQAQVVKVGKGEDLPMLLDYFDPNDRTILIDPNTQRRYRLQYELVDNSYSEGSKMLYWNANYDINRNGNSSEAGEIVANAYWTHLYIYKDLEGSNPDNTSEDSKKIAVGGPDLQIPQDAGPSGQGLKGYLRNASEKGTIVFSKSPALDNLPLMLTQPGIWEALGLPITPFLDSERAGKDIKTVTEKDIQPYQIAKVTLVDADSDEPIRNTSGKIVSFTGTNPIDVPNCSNCHANENANQLYTEVINKVQAERDYWKSLGASDWYAAQKATSISILSIHDLKHATTFTARYNPKASGNRLGHSPVLCQKCHADNVIGVLTSAQVMHKKDGLAQVMDITHADLGLPAGTAIDRLDEKNPNIAQDGTIIPALSEALHSLHLRVRPMPDGQGRTGACQGCHPAHRQDRSMEGYPITEDGKNAYNGEPGSAGNDNRDARGGCFSNRDVHSNPKKDRDGVETPEHLNAIGQWLKENVARHENGKFQGLWCTNCHQQISKELYQLDNLPSGMAFTPEAEHTLREKSLEEIAVELGKSIQEILEGLDPRVKMNENGQDVGISAYPWRSVDSGRLTANIAIIASDGKNPVTHKDADGDASVRILDANPNLLEDYIGEKGVTVPYGSATHGRDYWLSPGEPHCADCHQAPFVEGQGGMAFPINQPGKYSLMRYAKGHVGLACQACHESIHGLYPVTDQVDKTSYEQAAALNRDGSHGPIKCAACHEQVNKNGVPVFAIDFEYGEKSIGNDFDLAVAYIHANAPDAGGKGGNPFKE